jgi:hypothetical protein
MSYYQIMSTAATVGPDTAEGVPASERWTGSDRQLFAWLRDSSPPVMLRGAGCANRRVQIRGNVLVQLLQKAGNRLAWHEAIAVTRHELEGNAGMQDDFAERASRRTALAGEEVDRRKVVLLRLQDVLAVRGVESVIVGRHALTLRGAGPAQPSGPADPELHVLGTDRCRIVTTDGRHYRFADSRLHPADDPRGAARSVLSADIGHDDAGRQAPELADRGPGGRDRTVVGVGERALRRLCDDGVI